MHLSTVILLFTSAAVACPTAQALATQGPWEQCGGINWTGSTICTAGWTCVEQNPWYSQCLQPTGALSSTASSATVSHPNPTTQSIAAVSTSTARVEVPSSTVINSLPSSSPTSSAPAQSGLTFKASFTHYGAGDSFGSPNCNTNTAACAFYTFPGFSAAVSQNLYGVGPGAGAGPACGTCWKLTGETDSSGNKLSNAGTTIIVMVNNLCPAAGNPLCSQGSLTDTNQYGANVNFDLCSDSGAEAAFFGNDGVGLAVGTATQVDCSEWSGTIVH